MKMKILQITFFFVFTLLLANAIQSQSIQQSLCRSGINVPIVNHSIARDSIIVFLGNGCIVHDVNFKISNIIHTWISDIRLYLRKSGVGSLLVDHVGGSGDNFINTILDDSALIPLASGTPPFTGTYRPSNPLLPFNGVTTDGVWKIEISDTATGDTGALTGWCVILTFTCPTGGIQTVEIPNTYMLCQNYPNPFNPVTKIKYGLPENGNVKLTVYDELGKEVDILQDGYLQANTYEAIFDATNLPSGVYYYKLETDGYSDTKKMVIIK
jgi:subtilisin-like proprotein convertase family protein